MTMFNVLDYGVVGDGTTLNTESIRKVMEACEAAGGGTVYFPAGTYLTGAIHLKSHMTLHIDSGAKLLFSTDPDQYPFVKTRWSGYECYGYSPLVYGIDLTNVTIQGGGIIDGQGSAWWKQYHECKAGRRPSSEREKQLFELNSHLMSIKSNIVEWETQFLRPALLQMFRCTNVRIEGVTLQNSPFWNTHLVYCDNVTLHSLLIHNPSDTPNGDGLDIDSCRYVRISDCQFDVGDDCLCLKSGIDEDGRRIGIPTENVTVTNCTMRAGHGGVVLGSETAGGIRHVVISNCVFIGTDRGIRFKSNRARGGTIEHVQVNNIFMKGVLCPIAINSFYRYGVDPANPDISSPLAQPVTEATPVFRHIRLSHITATEVLGAAGFLYGLPEMPIEDVVLDHIHIEMTSDPNEQGGEPDMVREELVMAGKGMYCKYVRSLQMHHVRIETREGAALTIDKGEGIELHGFGMKRPHADTPVIELRDTQGAYVQGAAAVRGTDVYAQISGGETKDIVFSGNMLEKAVQDIAVDATAEGMVVVK
ncbi:glycoside hydrolase family 28 protein [Paenibacillus doosanensis]|uniref:glycoside hydrolase family 28 protein n=1 Tax=Paenibacillus doosanensis TaxID=1229154 RepID=UPI00217F9497|nr:glycoside hydrolase family 28 protein [Paenibacillus doosanensis]MCS7462357.1 glycoside hydrolase family 28 protein [Paenibacillus doosanensis]